MSHTLFAARAFGWQPHRSAAPVPADLPSPEPRRVIAVLGESGAGKSLALRAWARRHGAVVAPTGPLPANKPVLELFPPGDSAAVLRALSSCGLADGRLWALPVRCLSAGEQQRLRVALALHAGARWLVLDEFDAHLDAFSACALAQALARLAARAGLCMAISTHRPEVLPFLAPAAVVRLGDGAATREAPPPAADLMQRLEIAPGSLTDWRNFARWHYLGEGRPGPSSAVFVGRLGGRPVGIAMFGYPHLWLKARALALPRFAPSALRATGPAPLNEHVRLLQRIVVDPRVRGLGVAQALLAHSLPRLGLPFVECLAQLGAFSGFLSAAGFRHVTDLEPHPQARALLTLLHKLGLEPAAVATAAARRRTLAALPAPEAAQLGRRLEALLRSRIQTGCGALRRAPRRHEGLLDAAVARLHCRPTYFLWERP
ncbi:MAG: hypothetical protein IT463_12255 [Planctomycetes bacterium]|nr:hypothetical protein [Planctomycetota bacterium]